MGRRLQAYLIARVNTAREEPARLEYRCVGAIYHQSIFAERTLKAAHLFERLAKQKDNAALLREDLRRYAERNETDPAFPCLYASWLLYSAFSYESSAQIIECNEGTLVHGAYSSPALAALTFHL